MPLPLPPLPISSGLPSLIHGRQSLQRLCVGARHGSLLRDLGLKAQSNVYPHLPFQQGVMMTPKPHETIAPGAFLLHPHLQQLTSGPQALILHPEGTEST